MNQIVNILLFLVGGVSTLRKRGHLLPKLNSKGFVKDTDGMRAWNYHW